MSQLDLQNPAIHRDIDPNVLQRRASDPDVNVWVNASAGTGKTKVLTDRVLRLLLPRNDGRMGSDPGKILCLTFTKAGASEMILRVQEKLSSWVVMPISSDGNDNDLSAELTKLLGQTPTKKQISVARGLFRRVVDLPNGLQIMTIHSFCQSVLARFPLEAELSPDLVMLDEGQSRQLKEQALSTVLSEVSQESSSSLSASMDRLAHEINADQLLGLLASILGERDQFEAAFKLHISVEGIHQTLCELHNVTPNVSVQDFILSNAQERCFDREGLKQAALAMLDSKSVTDQKKGALIEVFLSCNDAQGRADCFYEYVRAFMKSTGGPYEKLVTVKLAKACPQIPDVLSAEANRLLDVLNALKAIKNARLTADLLYIGKRFLDTYTDLKKQRSALDFDDQILKTLELLRTSAAWVMYKLDQGIDHILVDEAQDTNPEQWQIIEALYQEFYMEQQQAGANPRTMFVVGDEKQSIYGFQRASPEKFSEMHDKLKSTVRSIGHAYDDVGLNTSFRTTPSVLRAVDLTFSDAAMRAAISSVEVAHSPFRRGQAGLVELWPICKSQVDGEDDILWNAYKNPVEQEEGSLILANQIADQIHGWIANKEVLESHDRPIGAGDIMILVRSRTKFVHQLMRALKARSIPVSGADRLIVTDHIGVHDLMALMQFVLLPNDDLNLAALLKSPLIGLNDDDLYSLSFDRTDSLWDALHGNKKYSEVFRYLACTLSWASENRPYEFFNLILTHDCPAHANSGMSAFKNRLGADVQDVFYEFLNLALRYEETYLPDFQGFIEWLKQNPAEIKRELDSTKDEVRIMTVHGSKGLQAPIVILPDTVRVQWGGGTKSAERLLWPRQTDMPVPVWCARSNDEDVLYKENMQSLKLKAISEDKRLLYVAMTRAEERLYVCGYQNSAKKPIEQSWHCYIEKALKAYGGIEQDDNGVIRLRNVRIHDPDRLAGDVCADQDLDMKRPDWLYQKVAKEHALQYPINPSQLADEDEIRFEHNAFGASNSLSRDEAILRGNIIHKLLELLPDINVDARHRAAEKYCKSYQNKLPEAAIFELMDEAFDVLNKPEFAKFYGDSSIAEVPILAKLDQGRSMSGVIDRLCVLDDVVWVIDYKSGFHVPSSASDVPESYRQQMEAYKSAVQKIYPNHTVKSALLWTRTAALIEV